MLIILSWWCIFDIPKGFLDDLYIYKNICYRIDEIEEMFPAIVLASKISWKGIVTKEQALNAGFSGVMLRGSGVTWDT